MKRTLSVFLAVLLCLSMALALVGCGGGGSGSGSTQDGKDTRASAEQTFGRSALDSLQSEGVQLTADDQPTTKLVNPDLLGPEFALNFFLGKLDFMDHLTSAISQAGVQGNGQSQIMPFDTVDISDLFVILALYDLPDDEIIEIWQELYGQGNWTVSKPNFGDFLTLVFSKDGVPAVEIDWRWLESEQYLFAVYTDAVGERLELDVAKTSYGFSAQIYDPDPGVLYSMAFSDGGSWDGSIGYLADANSQPAALDGTEALDFGVPAPYIAEQSAYFLIDGTKFDVKAVGETKAKNYTIKPTTTANSGSGQASGGQSSGSSAQQSVSIGGLSSGFAAGSGHELSAEEKPYARLWHGSAVLASGWSERFALYPDGTFIWAANDMDGATRMRYLAGCWDVVNGELQLTIEIVVAWEGGTLVNNNNNGSYASSQIIQNPTEVVYEVADSLSIPISKITRDNQRSLDTVTINELQCWDYTNQADDAMSGFWNAILSAYATTGSSGSAPTRGL